MPVKAALDIESRASESGTGRLLALLAPAFGWLRRPLVGACVGIVASSAAFMLRLAVHGALPPGFPFLTFFPAVVVTSYLCGARSGIVCALLSGVFAWYYFIPPFNSFELDASVIAALALYVFVVFIDILLMHLLQDAVSRQIKAETATRWLLAEQRKILADLQRETQSRELHQQIAEKSLLLDFALKAASAGTWHYCVRTGRALLSAEMARQHGLGDIEIEIDVGREWTPLVHPEDAKRTLADLQSSIETRGNFQTDFRILLPSGETRWVSGVGRVEVDEDGNAEWVVGLTFDVTARKIAEQRIDYLARHDSLTGLANRAQFRERLIQEIALYKRRATPFALLCLDLDHFKCINDTCGHSSGDSLLVIVANRMKSLVRLEDTIARLGGDEFVIIQAGVNDRDGAEALAARLIESIQTPMMIEGRTIAVGVSIGIALASSDSLDPDVIYKIADRALYKAKEAGRGTFRQACRDDASGDIRVSDMQGSG